MAILDVIPHTLFRVFVTPARSRNTAVLEEIYSRFFCDHGSAPTRQEILEAIRDVFRRAEYVEVDEDDDQPNSTEPSEAVLLRKLCDDGWLMEFRTRRTLEYYLPREAHALLFALTTLSEDLSVDIVAEASLVEAGLQSAYSDPAEKAVTIAAARAQALKLRGAVDGVLSSLRKIEVDMLETDGLSELLAQFMDHFVDQLLLQNYRALKTSRYNPMRFQRVIVEIAEQFINDEAQITRAAVALSEQGLAADLDEGARGLRRDLSVIREVFVGLADKLSVIDRFSYRLERRIATTVRYQESAASLSEGQLRKAIIGSIAALEKGLAESISPFANFKTPYSTATLMSPRKPRTPVTPAPREPKPVDPVFLLRDQLMEEFAASMTVTPHAVDERLRSLATKDAFVDLDAVVPASARDLALLYAIREAGYRPPEDIELIVESSTAGADYISGPHIKFRARGARS